MALASVYALLAGGTALLLLLPSARDRAADATDGPPTASVPYSVSPRCHAAACEGRDPVRQMCGVDPDT
ncbi:XRE family transcriptional regulator, partial [Streptomyces sp. TRM76130]|nr:XRE family transcriptional regulator [Streptomyces sp. TRM76130]